MKIFNKKNENKISGNNIIIEMALKEALKELKEEKDINGSLLNNIKTLSSANKKLMEENGNLTNNIHILISTNERIEQICKASKTSKIAKAILKELGE